MRDDQTPGLLASMGPLIFISGNCHRRSVASARKARFNGATDFHQWKFHPNSSVTAAIRAASMGPLIFISGNLHTVNEIWNEPVLQWGH